MKNNHRRASLCSLIIFITCEGNFRWKMHFTTLKHVHLLNPLQMFRVRVCLFNHGFFFFFKHLCCYLPSRQQGVVFLCFSSRLAPLHDCIGKPTQKFSDSNLCTKHTTFSRFSLFLSYPPIFGGLEASGRLFNDYSNGPIIGSVGVKSPPSAL